MARRCNSCDGILGVDCFNESECEYISHQIEMQKQDESQMQIHFLEERIDVLEAKKAKLLEALKRFVDVCDNGNPIDIFNALGSCVEPARQAIAEAEGKP